MCDTEKWIEIYCLFVTVSNACLYGSRNSLIMFYTHTPMQQHILVPLNMTNPDTHTGTSNSHTLVPAFAKHAHPATTQHQLPYVRLNHPVLWATSHQIQSGIWGPVGLITSRKDHLHTQVPRGPLDPHLTDPSARSLPDHQSSLTRLSSPPRNINMSAICRAALVVAPFLFH